MSTAATSAKSFASRSVVVEAEIHAQQAPFLRLCYGGEAESALSDGYGDGDHAPKLEVDSKKADRLRGDGVKVAQSGFHDDEAALLRHAVLPRAQEATERVLNSHISTYWLRILGHGAYHGHSEGR